jgi:hypothetical protein
MRENESGDEGWEWGEQPPRLPFGAPRA